MIDRFKNEEKRGDPVTEDGRFLTYGLTPFTAPPTDSRVFSAGLLAAERKDKTEMI